MTPFTIALKDIRLSRSLNQRACADKLGWTQSYLSSFETGVRPAPKRRITEYIAKRLGLTEGELVKLQTAAENSREIIRIPKRIDLKKREILLRLSESLSSLSDAQVNIISLILTLEDHRTLEAIKM